MPKIFPIQSSHPGEGREYKTGKTRLVQVDKPYYNGLTDQLLDHFYPKFCCGERLVAVDGKRDTVLRCPQCHKQQKIAASWNGGGSIHFDFGKNFGLLINGLFRTSPGVFA